MATRLGDIDVAITVDDADFQAKMAGAESRVNNFASQSIGAAGSGMSSGVGDIDANSEAMRNLTTATDEATESQKRLSMQMSGEALVGAGEAISAMTEQYSQFASMAVDAASDLNESQSAVGAVFGESSGEIEDFANSAAQNLGITETASLQASAQMGAMFQSMGLGIPEITKMSQELQTASADLGSFHNAMPTEVLGALQAGLRGEAEPLRRFGILLSADAVEAKGLEMGIVGVGDEMTESQKVQARYALVMEQLGAASGDFARTSEGLANSQRINQAAMADLRAEIGQNMLPMQLQMVSVQGKLIQALNDAPPALQQFAGVAMFAAGQVGPLVTGIGRLMMILPALGSSFSLLLGPIGLVVLAFAALFAAYKTNFLGFGDLVNATIAKAVEAFNGLVSFFNDTLIPAFQEGGLVGALTAIKDALIDTFTSIDWAGIGQNILGGIQGIGNAIGSVNWQGISDAIGGALQSASDTLMGWFNTLGTQFEEWSSGVNWGGVALAIVQGIGNALQAYADVYAWIFGKLGDFGAAAAQWVGKGLASLKTAWDSLWADSVGADGAFAETFTDRLGDLTAPVTEWIGNVETALTPAWEEIKTGVTTAFEDIKADLSAKTADIQTDLAAKWEDIKSDATAKMGELQTDAAAKFEDIKTDVIAKMGDVQTDLAAKWEDIKSDASAKAGELQSDLAQKFDAIKQDMTVKIEEAKGELATKFEEIKTNAETKIGELQTALATKFEEVKSDTVTKIEDMKTELATKFEEIKTDSETKIGELQTALATKWEEIKSDAETKLEELKAAASEKFEALKTEAGTKFEEMKTLLVEKWEAIKTDATTKLDELRTTATEKFEALKNEAGTKFDELKTLLAQKWEDIKADASAKLEEIKTAIATKWGEIATDAAAKWEEIKQAILTKIGEIATEVATKAEEIKTGFLTKLGELATEAATKVAGVKDAIIGAFANAGEWLRAAGASLVGGFIQGITDRLPDLDGAVANLGNSVGGALNSVGINGDFIPGNTGYDAGGNVSGGMSAGIRDGQGNVETAAAGLGTAAIGAINDATLSESPSRLAYQSGGYVVEGFGNALTDGATQMPAYVKPLIDALITAFDNFLNDLRELFGVAVTDVSAMSDSIFTAIDTDVTNAVQRVRDLQDAIRNGDFSIKVDGNVHDSVNTTVSNRPGVQITNTMSKADKRAAKRAARHGDGNAPAYGSASGNASYSVDAGHQSQHYEEHHTREPATVTYNNTTVVLRDERDLENYVAEKQRAERRNKGRG